MKIRYELIKRTIAGETFLVPIGEGAKKFNGMFALNELGDFLWERIPAAKDPAELVELVLAEYDVTRETAEEDTSAFLGELASIGLLELSDK